MILQNLYAMSKNRQKLLVCPLISFRGHVTKSGEYVFYCRWTYVVWQSFEKIGAETADKVRLEKKNSMKNSGRSSVTETEDNKKSKKNVFNIYIAF